MEPKGRIEFRAKPIKSQVSAEKKITLIFSEFHVKVSMKKKSKLKLFVFHPILIKLDEIVVPMYATTSPSFIKIG